MCILHSSFFKNDIFIYNRVKEMITFFTKTITKRTPLGQRQSVQNEGKSLKFIFNLPANSRNHFLSISISEYFVHVYMRSDGLCACITCDAEYPPRVAFSLLTKLLEDFGTFYPNWPSEKRQEAVIWPQLEKDLTKYQDPANADQIMVIRFTLIATILKNNIIYNCNSR